MEPTHFESLYPEDSRFSEIEKILGYVKQGNSCQTIGLPGVGQSTILKLLIYNKNVRLKHLGTEQKKIHFVLANFSEVRRRPLVDVTKFLFLSLVDSLRYRKLEEEYEKTYAIFKESIALNDELVLFQGLKHALDILTIEKDLTIVFLFDRFEEYIPVLQEEFFANLRVLRNRAKYRFSVVFSLNRPLEDSIDPVMMKEFYEFLAGHFVYLPIMDKPGVDFRIHHLESITNKKLPPKVREEIFALTGGLGKLVKTCTEIILSEENTLPADKKDYSDFFLNQRTILGTLAEIWRALSPSEQSFLQQNTSYADTDIDYPYLSKIGLLRNDSLTIPLFEAFVKDSLSKIRKEENQKLFFDSNTNEIKQGETILSDRLTSSEYRLLRFLIERADTVIERNEIIDAVWKDAVSTEGVTDQALDQLLFRVRKKIEDDPNKPLHIQTVKGRGIRFTP
jgi:DNA-binding winged helix-turn-helix (wHTH) protein